MVYQPHLRGAASAILTIFSNINISGKIIIHFNLLTHRFRIPQCFRGRQQGIDGQSIHRLISLTRLLTSLMAKSLERLVYNQFLPVPNPSMIFLTVTWHPRYSCTSQLVHPFTANCVKGEMCISSTYVDVFDRDSKVIKSWYNRFSVFEWVALLPRHCSFSTSCNRRMSI